MSTLLGKVVAPIDCCTFLSVVLDAGHQKSGVSASGAFSLPTSALWGFGKKSEELGPGEFHLSSIS
jgi:hypothetical protein